MFGFQSNNFIQYLLLHVAHLFRVDRLHQLGQVYHPYHQIQLHLVDQVHHDDQVHHLCHLCRIYLVHPFDQLYHFLANLFHLEALEDLVRLDKNNEIY